MSDSWSTQYRVGKLIQQYSGGAAQVEQYHQSGAEGVNRTRFWQAEVPVQDQVEQVVTRVVGAMALDGEDGETECI